MRAFYPFLLLALCAACSPMQNAVAIQHARPAAEVYGHTAILTADKMNVFYIGVDNPITVFVTGVRSDEVDVSIENGTITQDSSHKPAYIVRVDKPGEVRITVKASDSESSLRQVFNFRAKRIPDPVPVLGYPAKNDFSAAEFQAMKGLFMSLKDFDFEARCQPVGYRLTRISSNGERQSVYNLGMRYSAEAEALVKLAASGDVFVFSEITTLCPGDTEQRHLNNVAYFIQ